MRQGTVRGQRTWISFKPLSPCFSFTLFSSLSLSVFQRNCNQKQKQGTRNTPPYCACTWPYSVLRTIRRQAHAACSQQGTAPTAGPTFGLVWALVLFPQANFGTARCTLHCILLPLLFFCLSKRSARGAQHQWLVRATAAPGRHLDTGPGWPCFQWLPPRWVASPFYFLPLPLSTGVVLFTRSRARPKVGCSQV
jgi:hypothetical protein